jgi:hypothetical protein
MAALDHLSILIDDAGCSSSVMVASPVALSGP